MAQSSLTVATAGSMTGATIVNFSAAPAVLAHGTHKRAMSHSWSTRLTLAVLSQGHDLGQERQKPITAADAHIHQQLADLQSTATACPFLCKTAVHQHQQLPALQSTCAPSSTLVSDSVATQAAAWHLQAAALRQPCCS